MADEAARRGPGATAQARGLGQIGQTVVPVFTILLEPFRSSVSRIVLEQKRQRSEGARAGSTTVQQGAIDIRNSPRQKREAISIHYDVVVARVPEEAIGSGLEQGIRKEWALHEVDGFGQIGSHPSFCRAQWIGRGAYVDE